MFSQIAGAVALSVAAAVLPSGAMTATAEPQLADIYIGAFHQPILKVVGDGETEVAFDPGKKNVLAFTANRFGDLFANIHSLETGEELVRIDADGTTTTLPTGGPTQLRTHPVTGELYGYLGSIHRLTDTGWEERGVRLSDPWLYTFAVGADDTIYTADGWVSKFAPGEYGGEWISEFIYASKIAVADDGTIYADRVEGAKHTVVRLTADGEMTTIADGAVGGIETDAAGNVYLSRVDEMRIDVISPDGTSTSISTAPYKPTFFAVGAGR